MFADLPRRPKIGAPGIDYHPARPQGDVRSGGRIGVVATRTTPRHPAGMRRVVTMTLIVAPVAALSAVAGAVFGFVCVANAFWAHVVAPVNAVMLVAVLEDMHAGKDDDAIRLLESLLDASILEIAVAPSYGIFSDPPNVMTKVAKYRDEHPTLDAANSHFVDRVLSRYRPRTFETPTSSPGS